MDDALNPYLEWLGLRDKELPPNHYRLLGLERFEDDPHIISNAADGMMARVRSYRPGGHVRQWQQLLDELYEAKACLTDEACKRKYDESLRSAANTTESKTPSAPTPPTSSGATYMWPPGMGPASESSSTSPARSDEPSDAQSGRDASLPAQESPSASHAEPGNPALGDPSAPYRSAPYSPPQYGSATADSGPPPTGQPSYPAHGGSPNPMSPPPSNSGGWQGNNSPPVASPYQASDNPTAPFATPGGGDPMAPLASPISPSGQNGPQAPIAQPYTESPTPPSAQPTAGAASYPYNNPAPMAQPYSTSPGNVPQAQPVSGVPSPTAYPTAVPTSEPPLAATAPPCAGAPPDNRVTLSKLAGTSEAESPSLRTPSTAGSLRARSRANRSPAVYIVAAAGILLAVVVIAMMNKSKTTAQGDGYEGSPATPAVKAPTSKPKPNVKPQPPQDTPQPPKNSPPSSDSRTKPGRSPEPTDPPEMTEPEPPATEPPTNEPSTMEPDPPKSNPEPPQATPEQRAAVNRSLSKAYDALRTRKLDAAKSQIETASAMAIGPELKAKVARMRDLHNGVDNFWKAVRDTLKNIAGTSPEIQINNTRVLVVEADPDFLVIRVAGQNRRYTVDVMPTGLAVNLANQWFDQSAPSTKVFIGSFLLVDRNGKKEDARQLWQAAIREGADIQHMLPLLDESFDAPAEPAGQPPDAATLAKAVLALRGQRRAEVGAARSAQDKYRLAEALLDEAEGFEGDAAGRYARYQLALDTAARAVQPPLMWRIVEQMQASFEVDALKLKLDAIAVAAGAASNPLEYKAAARGALEAADACIEADRLKEASTVARIALVAARKAGDQELLDQAMQTTADLQELSAG